MFYDFAITVPAGTTESVPLIYDMRLTKGNLHRVEVGFRAGTDHRVFCRIKRGSYQLFPTDQDGAFCADEYTVIIDDSFDLDDEPLTLQAVCYSPTATYPHVVTVRLGVIDNTTILFLLKVARGLQKMLQLMRIPV